VPIKGLRNKARSATVLGGDGTQLARRSSGGAPWMNIPGILWLKVPDSACQTHGTVIKLELDGPLDFHASVGEVVTQN
jgi:alpha-L-fucosidase